MPYSPNVNYRAVARNKARKYGLDPSIFQRQIGAESSYSPAVISGARRSSAGALGIAQFMPGTAAGLHVNPLHPVEALDAAAKLMAGYVRKYGSYRNALVAYNAGPGAVGGSLPGETQRYISNILRGANPTGLSKAQRAMSPGRSVTVRTSSPGSTSNGLSVPSPDMSGLSSLLAQQQAPQLPYASPLAAPAFSAQKYVPGGGGITSYGPQQPQQTGGSLADALASIGQSVDPTLSGIKYPGTSNTVTVKGQRGAGVTAPPGKAIRGFHPGSPVPGQGPHGATHPTAGLPGYPAYDYMAPAGTAALAPVTGRVIKLSGHDPRGGPTDGPHGPFGWSVYIKGNDGRIYYLTHMGARNVHVGQTVRAGQRIGAVGDYAKWGGANHIHMGVHG